MAYTDQATLAGDATFRNRVCVAHVISAVNVAGEAQGGTSNAIYRKRQVLATDIASHPTKWLDAFVWCVAADTTISGASSDSTIQNRCDAVFNDIAGVYGTD